MKAIPGALLIGTLTTSLLLAANAPAQDLGSDLSLHKLLIAGQGWEPVAEELGFADAPFSDHQGNFYYSDLRGDNPGIYRLSPDGKKTRLSEEPVSGLKLGPDGRIYACQGSKTRLIAIDLKSGEITTLAEGVRPNDLVVTHLFASGRAGVRSDRAPVWRAAESRHEEYDQCHDRRSGRRIPLRHLRRHDLSAPGKGEGVFCVPGTRHSAAGAAEVIRHITSPPSRARASGRQNPDRIIETGWLNPLPNPTALFTIPPEICGNAPALKILIAITGASGTLYAQRLLDYLAPLEHEVHLVLSQYAHAVVTEELPAGLRVPDRIPTHGLRSMNVPFVSGSNPFDAMVVVPCSMGTLARIAHGISDDVLLRAADVILKERKQLILVPRETPLNLVHLKNMELLLLAGATILPANPSFYSRPQTLTEIVDTVVARIMDHLAIPHQIVTRWQEERE
jgi:flavin prenyltransferase